MAPMIVLFPVRTTTPVHVPAAGDHMHMPTFTCEKTGTAHAREVQTRLVIRYVESSCFGTHAYLIIKELVVIPLKKTGI